jgi:type II secretory pathway pseudopilin PulG
MRYQDRKRKPREQGFALILVLIALVILTLLAMALSYNAITDMKISDNHKASAQAWHLAEEGIYQAKEFIRNNGFELNEVLGMNKTLANYSNDPVFAPDTYGYRYPISLSLARTLSFFRSASGAEQFPSATDTKDGRGIITRRQMYPDLYNDDVYLIKPAAEARAAAGGNYANGYFAVRVVNNLSDAEINLGGDPFVDKDNRVLIRSVGMVRTFNSDIASGADRNNSVSVLEAMVRRDKTLDTIAPMVIIGPCVNAALGTPSQQHSYLFDGYDHPIPFTDKNGNLTLDKAQLAIDRIAQEGIGGNVPSHGAANPQVDGFGIAALYQGGASGVVSMLDANLLKDQKNGSSRVIGRSGQTTGLGVGGCNNVNGVNPNELVNPIQGYLSRGQQIPATGEITSEIMDPSSPRYNKDATYNFFDVKNLRRFADDIRSTADLILPGDTRIDGNKNPLTLGTLAQPKIIFADGNLWLKGPITGAGVLVVNGSLRVDLDFYYTGVILSLGGDNFHSSGSHEQRIIGAVFLAKIDAINPISFGIPSLTVQQDVNFYYSSDAIRYAINHLPFEALGFREVRSEYEKSSLSTSVLKRK